MIEIDCAGRPRISFGVHVKTSGKNECPILGYKTLLASAAFAEVVEVFDI